MNTKFFIIAILISTLWACDSGPANKTKSNEKEKPQWVKLETKEGGYLLNIFVPTPDIAKGEVVVKYLEDSGELRVTAGAHFDYSMFEDESQMQMTLNEIRNHPFYKVEIVEKTDSTLLYRLYLENNSKETWQFYAERSLGQPLLLIRSNKAGVYSEFYARKMLESALKITPLQ